MNYVKTTQYYEHVPLQLIPRKDYPMKAAKRFRINDTNQNVWIPNKHLERDGTLKPDQNLLYIFKRAKKQLELAKVEPF